MLFQLMMVMKTLNKWFFIKDLLFIGITNQHNMHKNLTFALRNNNN